MKKLFAAITAAFLMAAAAIPAAAAAGPVTKEYIFTATGDDYEYTDNQLIEIDGAEYEAVGCTYEIVSTQERIEYEQKYENLIEQEVPESITQNGQELTLETVDYTPKAVRDNQVYRDYVVTPAIPDNFRFKVDGNTVQGKLVDTKTELSATYNVSFACDGKFYGDKDCMYYTLNGKQIPAESAPTFEGYEEELLEYLDLDPDIYRVDSGRWATDYYTEDGKTARSAVYSGMQRSTTYTAVYEATVYDALAVYTNGINGDAPEHTVKAIVRYEPVDTGIDIKTAVLIGAGVIVLVALIVAILMLLKKKKQNQEKN